MRPWLMRPVRCVPGPLDTPCILWTGCVQKPNGPGTGGYGQVRINGRTRLVHRVVFQLANGHAPDVCRHRCDVPLCINALHLQDGTHADNCRDKMERGRGAVGNALPQSKLTAETVRSIRKQIAAGVMQKDIAKQYGVKQPTVSDIARGVTWGHVESI